MVPVVDVDHAPTTVFATEAYTLSLSISAPVSGSILVPTQLGSAGGRGLETPPTVSDHALLRLSLLITGHLALAVGS